MFGGRRGRRLKEWALGARAGEPWSVVGCRRGVRIGWGSSSWWVCGSCGGAGRGAVLHVVRGARVVGGVCAAARGWAGIAGSGQGRAREGGVARGARSGGGGVSEGP